jgi:hypothetical protein
MMDKQPPEHLPRQVHLHQKTANALFSTDQEPVHLPLLNKMERQQLQALSTI